MSGPNPSPPPRPLAAHPCTGCCAWAATGHTHDAMPLFGCSGCGSEWVRTQPWTPIGADGLIPADIAAEVRRAVC